MNDPQSTQPSAEQLLAITGKWCKRAEVLLRMGELSAQELRSVMAATKAIDREVRAFLASQSAGDTTPPREPDGWIITTELRDGSRERWAHLGPLSHGARDACDFGEPVPFYIDAPPSAPPTQPSRDWDRINSALDALDAAPPTQEPTKNPTLAQCGEPQLAGGDRQAVNAREELRDSSERRASPALSAEPPAEQAPPQDTTRWIPVGERLPDKDVSVLVFAPGKPYPISVDSWATVYESPVPWSSKTIPVGDGWESGYEFEDVTHWMPLLEPPK